MAGESLGEAFVTLRSDDARLQPDIEAQLTKALGPVVAKGAKILAGLFVGKQVVGVARAGIAELAEAEKQVALLGGQLRATGGAAGITAAHIQDLAAANLQLAGTDDEVTLAAERVLLQFNRITAAGGVFDETLRSAQDLALVTGQDLPAATRVLGLALQDPLKATRLLRSENIALSASQQEQIKNFIAAGNILGAQRVILDQVARSVGGTAEQYGTTLAGDLQRAQEELENTKASLLEGATPALELFASATGVASDAIQGLPVIPRSVLSSVLALAGFAPSLLQLRSTLLSTSAAKAALAATDATGAGTAAANTAAIEANTAALVAHLPAVESNVIAETELAAAETSATVAAGTARTGLLALAATAAPFVAVAALVGVGLEGLAQSFHLFGQGGEHFSIDLKGAVPSVQDFSKSIAEMQPLLDLTGRSVTDVANDIAQQSIPAARNYNAALREQGLSTDEVTAAIDKQEAAQRALNPVTDDGTQSALEAAAAQTARLDAITGSVSAEDAYRRSVADVASAQRGAASAARALNDAQQALNDALRGASAEDIAKGELSIESARIGLTTASQAVADEEAKLARLRSGMSGTVEELAAQESRLADARDAADRAGRSLAELERDARINTRRGIELTREQRIAIEDAAKSASDASQNAAEEERKLAALRSPASVQAITDEELKLEQARIAQQTATFAVTDAESALQVIQAKGTESDQAVIDARQRVVDASQNVTDANARIADSYTAEIDAIANLRNAHDLLAGKQETALTKANNLRAALTLLFNQAAPGSPTRKNLEDEIALLDQLLGKGAVGSIIGGALGGPQGVDWLQKIFGIFGVHAATGFAGTVTRPTGIVAGEHNRAEDVLIVPHAQGGIAGLSTGGAVMVDVGGVHFHGVVPSAAEAYRTGAAVGSAIADILERRAVNVARKIA